MAQGNSGSVIVSGQWGGSSLGLAAWLSPPGEVLLQGRREAVAAGWAARSVCLGTGRRECVCLWLRPLSAGGGGWHRGRSLPACPAVVKGEQGVAAGTLAGRQPAGLWFLSRWRLVCDFVLLTSRSLYKLLHFIFKGSFVALTHRVNADGDGNDHHSSDR